MTTLESGWFTAVRTGQWAGPLDQLLRDLRPATDDQVTSRIVDPLLRSLDRVETEPDVESARLRREIERVIRAAYRREHPAADARDIAISVIVTAHDVAPWIGEALESIRDQVRPELEVIVVDDHSTDGTSEIVDAVAAADPRFRVVRPVLRGGANARNVGIDLSRGEFIAFCDGDDVVADGAYERLLAGVTSDRTDIVFGNFERFSEERTSRSTAHITSLSQELVDVAIDDHADLIANRSCWNKLFRATTWRREDLVFVESARANDLVAVTSAYLAADRVSVVTSDVYRYRERPGGTSMTARSGAAASLAAYLEQERQCRMLVAAAGRRSLTVEHERVSLKASTWGQVGRYLGRDADVRVDREVQVAMRALLDAFAETGDTWMTRRIVFALVATGSPHAASTWRLAQREATTTDEIVEALDGLAVTVASLPDPDRPWQVPVVDAFDKLLARRLRSAAGIAVDRPIVREAVGRAVDVVTRREPTLLDHPTVKAITARPAPSVRSPRRIMTSWFGRGPSTRP